LTRATNNRSQIDEEANKMINIKERNVVSVGEYFDYELENGVLLHQNDWNGEYYEVDGVIYRPVYQTVSDIQEEIIGFEIW
jgi:hypothetical protein